MFPVLAAKPQKPVQEPRKQAICQPRSRVNRILGNALVGMFCITASACTVTNSLSPTSSTSELAANSTVNPAQVHDIGSEDAEIIKTTVASADTSGLLAWQNPETGSKGTITAINNFIGDDGKQCKKFQTTVDSFMGISLYNGETCELRKGFWVLSWFLREDG